MNLTCGFFVHNQQRSNPSDFRNKVEVRQITRPSVNVFLLIVDATHSPPLLASWLCSNLEFLGSSKKRFSLVVLLALLYI